MKRLVLLFISSLLFVSCQEDELLRYDESISGRSIYFLEKFRKTTTATIDRDISFGFAREIIKDSIIRIPIGVTGKADMTDLSYSVKVDQESSLVRGEHFDFVKEPVIRKGKTIDTLVIVFHRTDDLLTERKYMTLVLEPNQNFNTNIPNKTNSNINQDLLSVTIALDDMFPVSYHWQGTLLASTVGYFGEYSREKIMLMMEVLDLEAEVFFDPVRGRLSIQNSVAWSSYLKFWLNEEKEAGRIYYDSNHKEITMGPYAR